MFNRTRVNPFGFSPLWFEPHLAHVGKPSPAYGWSGVFFPRFSGFCPPLMNNQLDISEIFLKGPQNPNQKKKKKKCG